jgi:hypothetical protein
MRAEENGLLVYVVLVAVLAVIAHWFSRRFWVNCFAVAAFCSVVNLGHEVVASGFRIRPSDVAFWLPMILVYGAAVALAIAALVGLPFVAIRRRKRPATDTSRNIREADDGSGRRN